MWLEVWIWGKCVGIVFKEPYDIHLRDGYHMILIILLMFLNWFVMSLSERHLPWKYFGFIRNPWKRYTFEFLKNIQERGNSFVVLKIFVKRNNFLEFLDSIHEELHAFIIRSCFKIENILEMQCLSI